MCVGSIAKPRFSVIEKSRIGKGTVIRDHVNLYGCTIGKGCKIESFVYIEEGVVVGDRCKIKPHVFVPTGVRIGNRVFIGPGVIFTNDMYPTVSDDWRLYRTVLEDDVSIGAGATVIPGVRIGKGAMIGAGSVVTHDVAAGALVYGNPARRAGRVRQRRSSGL